MIRAIGVVVPAKDEERLLPACVDSLRAAADELATEIDVAIVLATDSCTDTTVAAAGVMSNADHRVRLVTGRWGCAGAARSAGSDHALGLLAGHGAHRIWLASTDADTVVPRAWLTDQVTLADAGVDAIAGIVTLGPARPRMRTRFEAAYPVVPGEPHPYVHGANLGVRATAYVAVGGWSTGMATGEDQHLWDRLRLAGHPTLATSELCVATSARLRSRAPDGFAARLRELSA